MKSALYNHDPTHHDKSTARFSSALVPEMPAMHDGRLHGAMISARIRHGGQVQD